MMTDAEINEFTAKILARPEWLVEAHPDDAEYVIYGGDDRNYPIMGGVRYSPDRPGGNPFPEEMARIWAASMPRMFPALALVRNELREILTQGGLDLPLSIEKKLRAIASLAATVLPVPTIAKATGEGVR